MTEDQVKLLDEKVTKLLEDAQARGQLELQKDEKSGGYLILSFGPKA